MGILIGIVIGLFVLARTNILQQFGITPGQPGTSPIYSRPDNVAAINAQLGAGFSKDQSEITAGLKFGTQAATQVSNALESAEGVAKGASALSQSIPIIGAAISFVAGALIAASEKRAKEATSENQALDAALPAWDHTVQYAVQLFNSGQITAAQVGQLLGTPRTMAYFGVPVGIAWQNLWREVGPQVQPGRNGCTSGSVSQTEGQSFCGGKVYGAACCVAYDNLDNSMGNPKLSQGDCLFAALKKALAQPGTPFDAVILGVYPSKYSTYSRPTYTVTIEAPLH